MRLPAIVLLAACYREGAPSVAGEPPRQAMPRGEPDFPIEGRWTYISRTNECNEGTGTGELELVASGGDAYRETGHIRWPDGTAIEWAGELRYSRSERAFAVTRSNSLGDEVESRWEVDRERGWLVVRWRQSNGCSGIGIATRPGAPGASFAALRYCARCRTSEDGCGRWVGDGDRRGRTYGHHAACAPLCCR